MGIAMKELLSLDYFKDFEVIAGAQGLQKEAQGVTVMDAPDSCRWMKGKELVLTSGYAISQEPDCIANAFESGALQKASGFIIKRDRYLNTIPEDMIRLFNENEIPLISMPGQLAYMEVMSQINTAVMNRTVERFRIQQFGSDQPVNESYKVQKIQRILQAVEEELNFPAFLYDVMEDQGYYSSDNFKKITEAFGLNERDYWDTHLPHTKHILCDYINMSRRRLIEPKNLDNPRISWIHIPIIINEVTQAYFIIMESREFIDFYDEYSIRIAFLMLQAIYEQLMVARTVSNVGFENFLNTMLKLEDADSQKLMYQASQQGISLNDRYQVTVLRQMNLEKSLRQERRKVEDIFMRTAFFKRGRFAVLDENEAVILWESGENSQKLSKTLVRQLKDFEKKAQQSSRGMKFEFGICCGETPLLDIKKRVEKCRRVMNIGRLLFPGVNYWDDESLGPLTWLQIPEDELKIMLKRYSDLAETEKNRELLRTLKIYLENNMNYSITADKMYVHINTVRKRIDKLEQLLPCSWESPVDRLKTEILLNFLHLDE